MVAAKLLHLEMNKTLTYLFLAGLSLAFLVSPMQAAENTLTRLNTFLQKKTFRSAFSQQVFDEKKTLIVDSTGTIVIQRPGKFRWEYLTPSRQVIIADGKNLLNYDPELEQASVHPMIVTLAYAPMMILLGEVITAKNFNIDIRGHAKGLDWIALKPKVDDTEFTQIELGLNEERIVEMILHDHFDQMTKIKFLNAKFGEVIDPVEFQFNLPPKTDIIGSYSLPAKMIELSKPK